MNTRLVLRLTQMFQRWNLKGLRPSKRKFLRTNRVKQSSCQLTLNIVTDQPDSKCNTVRWEPSWTGESLHGQQREDARLNVIIQYKEVSAVRRKWEDVSPYDCTVKTLWAQWNQLQFRDQVLCGRWEKNGSGTKYQIILPINLRETALTEHHNHTTAIHRGVNKILGALRAPYYWSVLTSHVKKWVRSLS